MADFFLSPANSPFSIALAIMLFIAFMEIISVSLGMRLSEKSFPGQVATTGNAHATSAAQAKLKDQHGQTHYILVIPGNPEEIFKQSETVIVVSQNGSVFKVIANTSSALTD